MLVRREAESEHEDDVRSASSRSRSRRGVSPSQASSVSASASTSTRSRPTSASSRPTSSRTTSSRDSRKRKRGRSKAPTPVSRKRSSTPVSEPRRETPESVSRGRDRTPEFEVASDGNEEDDEDDPLLLSPRKPARMRARTPSPKRRKIVESRSSSPSEYLESEAWEPGSNCDTDSDSDAPVEEDSEGTDSDRDYRSPARRRASRRDLSPTSCKRREKRKVHAVPVPVKVRVGPRLSNFTSILKDAQMHRTDLQEERRRLSQNIAMGGREKRVRRETADVAPSDDSLDLFAYSDV
ncbi:hypothetical protein EVG20_g11657 [Dentipellis fragilis]|uniref:Uncharacterized protein n=1 Tax=Dentipellis fragilis TaxID=205917 RepID=A0A4Y9XJG4_9AGAM|nr:hypothetical protein EVG20_g11657 [Dentipellis fragilis]